MSFPNGNYSTILIWKTILIFQADRKWYKTLDWTAFNNHWGKDVTGRGWGTGAGDSPTGYAVEKIGQDSGNKGRDRNNQIKFDQF